MSAEGTRRTGWWQAAATIGCAVAVALAQTAVADAGAKGSSRPAKGSTASSSSSYTYEQRSSPDRVLAKDAGGRVVATFTAGARTVVLAGPQRTFAESTTTATVTTSSWVRLLPAPFGGSVDETWLRTALADTSPDVLATAARFTTGAPEDASYGPLVDGARVEGSDWNDYYGVTAVYDGVEDAAEPDQRGAVDCSGYVRLVFGHLGGLPMVLQPDGVRLPRRAVQMSTAAPGVMVVANNGLQVTDLSRLLPGDLVLFDASTDDGTAVDHVGIYLGKDSAGGHRFLSSRKSVDGPTMGDYRGASKLNGSGLYASSFRAVRRL